MSQARSDDTAGLVRGLLICLYGGYPSYFRTHCVNARLSLSGQAETVIGQDRVSSAAAFRWPGTPGWHWVALGDLRDVLPDGILYQYS